MLQQLRVEQRGVAIDELVEAAGGPALAVHRDAVHPRAREGGVVFAGSPVRCRHVLDCVGHDRSRLIWSVVVQAPPGELQMLPVAEALSTGQDLL